MKAHRRFLATALLAAGVAAAGVSAAQTPTEDQPTAVASDSVHRSPAEVVEALGRKLSLTDDQKTKILPIVTERQQKMQAARDNTSQRPRQAMRQFRAIMADGDSKINDLLTADQQQGYRQLQEQMRAARKARGSQAASAP